MKRGWLSGKVDKWSCGSAVAYPDCASWPEDAECPEETDKPLRATGNCVNCGAPDDGSDVCSYCTTNRLACKAPINETQRSE